MNNKTKKIVALILAAGESSRLGEPKQNLPFGNRTLLNHIKEHLNLDIVDRTFIVLGAYANEVKERSGLEMQEVIEFVKWEEGMGSSLAYACRQIFNNHNYDGILITLSDLPLVEKNDYKKMCLMFDQEEDIIATMVNGIQGVPALFGKAYFNKLQELNGKQGAKQIINEHRNKVKSYLNERAAFDIDTRKSYLEIIKHNV